MKTDGAAESANVPLLSCALPPNARFPEYARIAERLGYARVWAFDSPALYGDVWVALARAADATEGIGLATGVAVPFSRHPMVTAAAIASVAELAPGRLSCAMGTGFSAAKALGRSAMPWREVTTYLERVRSLLAGATVEIDGAACRMIHSPGFAPRRPIDVPLYLAPVGPVGMAAAREHADGVLLVAPVEERTWPTMGLYITGTVLDPDETPGSPRVIDAYGPQYATGIHALWEFSPELVESVPGGQKWLAALEEVPSAERHLAVHEGHLVAISERDRALVASAGDQLVNQPWVGDAAAIRRSALDAARQGITELLYNASGSDIPGELERYAAAVRG